MIGGLLTKVLGMIIKIAMTRLMGDEGIGLYMLVLPTFSLFIGLGQFGLPVALSKLVAEDSKNNKKLLFSLIPISFFVNIIIIIFLIFFSPFLSNELLNEPRAFYPLLAVSVVIPLTSLSGLIRSYFFGKQQMLPHVVSNVSEDIIRLILIIIGVPIFLQKGLTVAVTYVILTNIVSELVSILVLFFFLPKKLSLKKSDIKPSKVYAKEALGISVPSSIGRLIGSIGYFLEPIILTQVLLGIGYSNNFIISEYGVISGYVFPLLLLPSFFTGAISQSLLPVVSKNFSNGNYKNAKKKIKQAILISLCIGIPVTLLFEIIPEVPLHLIYNTSKGVNYIRILAPICLFQYIQSPLEASLDACGKSKYNLEATFFGTILRTIFLFLASKLSIGLYGLVIATSVNVLFTTFHNLRRVQKVFREKGA